MQGDYAEKYDNPDPSDLLGIDLPFDARKVRPCCLKCVRKQLDKYKNAVGADKKSLAGKFIVNCKGILKEALDPSLRQILSPEEFEESERILDPAKWMAHYLTHPDGSPWIARWYQEDVVRCTSARKALRISRRTGKTEIVAAEIVWKLFTLKKTRIIVGAPQKIHAEEIMKRVRGFIYRNPKLADSVVKDISSPVYELVLQSGSYLMGFALGTRGKTEGLSVRGQNADHVYSEETAYIDEQALQGGLLPILQTTPDTTMTMFSTPTGFKSVYYNACEEMPEFCEFHYNYMVLPHWREVEKDRGAYTEEQWQQEMLALWGTSEEGVYKPSYVDRSLRAYSYEEFPGPQPGWRYILGVDWNEKHGAELCIVGENRQSGYYQVVSAFCIEKTEYTQLSSVDAVIQANRKWKPAFIFVDAGNGCLHANSLVQTQNGAKRIKNILAGDLVLTHKGQYKPVLNTVAMGAQKAYKIRPAFCLHTIASDSHRHMIYRSQDRFNDFPKEEIKLLEVETKEINPDTDFMLISREDITKPTTSCVVDLVQELKDIPSLQYDSEYVWTKHGYQVAQSIPTSQIIKEFNTSRATVQRTRRKLRAGACLSPCEKQLLLQLQQRYGDRWLVPMFKKIPRYIDICHPDFQYIYGWYLSEGYAGVNSIEICQAPFHYKEEIDRLIMLCSQRWDTKVLVRKNGYRRIFIQNALITELFRRIGGSHAQNKFIDPRIMASNPLPTITSLLYGDGHEHKHGITLSLTSFSLVMQVRQILANNGILGSLHRPKARPRTDGCWAKYRALPQLMLSLHARDDTVDWINTNLGTRVRSRGGIQRRKYIVTNKYILVPIAKFDYIGETPDMYDLTVDEDASFCANGFITHNSSNYELLRKLSWEQRHRNGDSDTARLMDVLRKYDSGASIETKDPVTGQPRKAPAKAYMVNASVRMFEGGLVRISGADKELEKQLRNYIVERFSPTGNPVYGMRDKKVKDHRLDAFNLCMVGFFLEFGGLQPQSVLTTVGAAISPITRKIGEPRVQRAESPSTQRDLQDTPYTGILNRQNRAVMPARIDRSQTLVHTNPGWATDEEEKYERLYAQQARGRKRRNGRQAGSRPSRSNI